MHRGLMRLDRQHNGGGFDGGLASVYGPNKPLPEVPPQANPSVERKPTELPSLASVVLGRLNTITPQDEKTAKQQAQYIARAMDFLGEVDRWIEESGKATQSELERQHSEIRAKGRGQRKIIYDLAQRLEASRRQIEANAAQHKRLLTQIELAQAEVANIDRWSSDEDAEKLEQKVQLAKHSLREFLPKETAAFETNRNIAAELQQAEAAMKAISDTETRLWHEIQDLPYCDPELGLSTQVGFRGRVPEPE